MKRAELPRAARYFPLEKGLYEVAPGLRSLGFDFGNGAADARLFQFDTDFPLYRENKIACRRERLGKYVCEAEFSEEKSEAVCRLIAGRLAEEYPGFFAWDGHVFRSSLTGESFSFDVRMRLLDCEPTASPPYASAFDALCSLLQEDIAVVSRRADKSDWLSALHLCAPSHWAAEDKIGKDFVFVHNPVPHIEKINKAAQGIVEAMIHKGPYVRFVWSFVTDQRLNHHPEPAPGWDAGEWKGRSFARVEGRAPVHLRVERQTIFGLPAVESSLFGIRVSFIDGNAIWENPRENRLLRSALMSMSPESRVYKGVAHCFDEVIGWLDSAPGL